MIWYLLYLCWHQSHNPLALAGLTVLGILTGTLLVCLWFKGAHEMGEIAMVRGMPPVILREGSEVWIANGQEERRLTVTRIKPMKDGKGFTLFVGKHSTRKPKEEPIGAPL
jgi:hypothetical protein